jgi:class 3 adenylate cyclase
VTRPRRSLFVKYFVTLFVAVVVPLLLGAASDAWFGYRDQRVNLDRLLRTESSSAASRIQAFTDGIRDELGWVVQLPWTDGQDERHRIDALRLLRQVPAIQSLTLLDQSGTERAFVSRLGLNRIGRGADKSDDSGFIGARESKSWFGSVRYEQGSEPYMTIAVAGNRAAAGVALADVNLKLIWDVIAAIKIGTTGHAFVVDQQGRLLAHPDISLVLRGNATAAAFSALTAKIAAADGSAVTANDVDGRAVVAVAAPISTVGWTVIAEQPVTEAFAPIRAALSRALALIAAGAMFALVLAWWLARRMSGPIRQLEDGVQRVGAGQFEHRIALSTGDELEQLADRFNEMAGELAVSREKSERINRLKRFLAPQVAELVENAGDDRLLDGQRRDIVAIFGDLRGFTAFSSHAQPEIIMRVLGEYYEALGAVITRYGATLTSFAGDGLMVLVNAPVQCDDPALRGIRLAAEMQQAVQALIVRWRADGHTIGFGVGLAMGPATVGRVGYEGRIDYTAIGSVVNLASRLCGAALDGQVLVDGVAATAAQGFVALEFLGLRRIKGYDTNQPVHAIAPEKVAGIPIAAHAAVAPL